MQEKRGGEMVQVTERKPYAGHSYIRWGAVERMSPRFEWAKEKAKYYLFYLTCQLSTSLHPVAHISPVGRMTTPAGVPWSECTFAKETRVLQM